MIIFLQNISHGVVYIGILGASLWMLTRFIPALSEQTIITVIACSVIMSIMATHVLPGGNLSSLLPQLIKLMKILFRVN